MVDVDAREAADLIRESLTWYGFESEHQHVAQIGLAALDRLLAERDADFERFRETSDAVMQRAVQAERLAHDRGEALRRIAVSYPWAPYQEDETIGDAADLDVGVSVDAYVSPTNRRIAREALAGVVPPEQAPTEEEVE